MSEKARVIELRDMALAVLKAQGQWQEVHKGPRLLVFHGAVFIAHRSFKKLPPSKLAHQSIAPKGAQLALPYGLDIFAGGKVLKVEWDDDDHIQVVTYRPGEWEWELEKLARETQRR